MLTVGDKFPDFAVQGVVSTDPRTAFRDLANTYVQTGIAIDRLGR